MPRKKKEEIQETIQEEKPVTKKRGRPKKAKTEAPEQTSDATNTENVTETKPKKGGVGGNGNLIPFDQLTEEEQRKIRSKGGRASVESRRRKKELREFMKDFLMQEANKTLKANMRTLEVDTEQMTNLAALCTRVFTKAMSTGDLNAARTVIEWAGMAPLQQEQENAAIARMSQVVQMAGVGGEETEEEEETVVFYIPQNGRTIVNGDDLVTITDG